MNDDDHIDNKDKSEDNSASQSTDNNIIDFRHVKELKKIQEKQEEIWREEYRRQQRQAHPYYAEQTTRKEPMFNLPPATKWLAGLFLVIHAIVYLVLNPEQYNWVLTNFAFIPAAYTTDMINTPLWAKIISPFSYMLLHGNIMHLGMNGIMLLAFGSGLERQIGAKHFLVFLVACGLAALIIHFAINMESPNPLIGASGALSGLFAGMLMILNKRGLIGTGKYGLWPIIGIWIGITVAFGFISSPSMVGDNAQIAWVAHLGGFMAGFLLLKPILRLKL